MLVSIAQYFTYRYRIDADGVVIRSGVFQRSLRHIPFARIQNVSLHQNLLHRLFGVAEVRLESAGAAKPEAQMRVLRLDDAHELERQVAPAARRAGASRRRRRASRAGAPSCCSRCRPAKCIRLGLINNRGMLVVGGRLRRAGAGRRQPDRQVVHGARQMAVRARPARCTCRCWPMVAAAVLLLLCWRWSRCACCPWCWPCCSSTASA